VRAPTGSLGILCNCRVGEELGLYRDTYYDRPGRDLTAPGRELRVRASSLSSGVRPRCRQPDDSSIGLD